MQKLSIVGNFRNFEISKRSMDQIAGSRSLDYRELDGQCTKIVDTNDGAILKIKTADRFEDRC